MSKLGIRIRELRKRNHLTQQELGDFLGVTKASISGYENGSRQPYAQSLAKLARLFNTTTDYLIGTSDDSSPNENTANMNDLLADRLDKNYKDLSEEDKRQIQEYIDFVIYKSKNK